MFIEWMRDNRPPSDLDGLRAWNDRWSSAKAEWLAEVPDRVRDAWVEYEGVPSGSLRIDDQERADAAFAEVSEWVEGTCRLSGFER